MTNSEWRMTERESAAGPCTGGTGPRFSGGNTERLLSITPVHGGLKSVQENKVVPTCNTKVLTRQSRNQMTKPEWRINDEFRMTNDGA